VRKKKWKIMERIITGNKSSEARIQVPDQKPQEKAILGMIVVSLSFYFLTTRE